MSALRQIRRHPWLDELIAAPDDAVDELLIGVAHLPGFQRASPVEAALGLMGDLPREEPEWAALDGGLTRWLQERRSGTQKLLGRPGGAQRFIRETGEGFRMAWRLDLPQAKSWVHDNFGDLYQWADASYSLDQTFDLARAVLYAGAHTQTGNEFRPIWFAVCEAAAQPRLRHRLDCALLGLSKLKSPHGQTGGPPPELIGGLCRWAEKLPDNDHTKQMVVREWRLIRAAFPRLPDFWRGQWRPLLAETPDKDRPAFADWLLEADKALKPQANAPKREPLLPKKKVVDQLIDKIRDDGLTGILWRSAQTMLGQMERYAEFTGNAYYFVTSATSIANLILPVAPGCALDLMRRALSWAGSDGHAWSVRAKALAQLERPDLAQAALWEGMRRTPSHPSLRHQLALLLSGTAGDGLPIREAVALLRKSISIDPMHKQSYPDLARLLWLDGKADEGIDLLQEFLKHDSNDVALYALALLLTADNRTKEARQAVADYRRLFADDYGIKRVGEQLAVGPVGSEAAADHLREHWGEKRRDKVREDGDCAPIVAWDAEALERAMDGELRDAPRLSRIADVAEADLLFGLGDDGANLARQKIDAALTRDADDVFAHLVKALAVPDHRADLEGQAGRFDNVLSLRLALLPEDAQTATAQRFTLADRFHQQRPLIALVGAARGEAEPAELDVLDDWSRSDSSWREGWEKFLKTRVAGYLKGDIGAAALKPLAHDALSQALDVQAFA